MHGNNYIGTIVLILMGLYFFCKGLKQFRERQTIKSIPFTTIRGIAMGQVQITGKAKKAQPLISPISGTECVFYRYTVERYELKGTSMVWILAHDSNSQYWPFWLEDETGRVMILPAKAQVILPPAYTTEGSEYDDSLVQLMEENNIYYKGTLSNYRMRFKEWYIQPEDQVFVIGTAQEAEEALEENRKKARQLLEDDDFNAKPETQNLDVVIANKDDTDSVFIISTENQKELIKKFVWQILLKMVGGASLTLYMLADLLKHLNMLH